MNVPLKQLLWTDTMFNLITCFLIFVNLHVWTYDKNIMTMAVYYLIYFFFRYISYASGAYLLLQGKTKLLFGLSLGSIVFQFFSIPFILPHISNKWLWVSLIGIPTACFASFYYVAFNQMISHYGKEKEYDRFFAIKNYVTTSISILMPLLYSFLILKVGFEHLSVIVMIFTSLCFFFLHKIPSLPFQLGKKPLMSDMIKTKSTSTVPSSILLLHAALLFVGTIYMQYKDAFLGIITFMVAHNPWEVGLLNVGYFLISTLALYLFQRCKGVSPSQWFAISMGIVSIATGLTLYEQNETLLLLSCFLFSFGNYFFNTLFSAVSFKLISKQDDYEKLLIILKRETVLLMGKTVSTLFIMFLSIQSLSSPKYPWLVVIIWFIIFITLIFYTKLNQFIMRKENGNE